MKRRAFIIAILLVLSLGTSFAFAATDSAVSMVSPDSSKTPIVVEGSKIMLSIKVIQPKTIRVSAYEQKQLANGEWKSVIVSDQAGIDAYDAKKDEEKRSDVKLEPELFECKNNLSFYTKKLEVTPGLYLLKVESLDASGNVAYSSEYRVIIKEESTGNTKNFDAPKSGTSQFLQNLLSKIFKS